MAQQNLNRVLTKPLETVSFFTQTNVLPGVLLLTVTVVAIVLANTRYNGLYFSLMDMPFTIGFGSAVISKPLLLWINDGLMAMFFFVVGLEIKREILAGELSDRQSAMLPVIAAVGGMVLPASLYAVFNLGTAGQHGWGIPMATDIAFTLGILALLGNRVPLSLKIFLTAFAIVDDLGAVAVIALFYSSDISLINLAIGTVFLGVMLGGNYAGIRHPMFYAILGIGGAWLAFLLSGVHATIAGVLAAFTIPVNTLITKDEYLKQSNTILDELLKLPESDGILPTEAEVSISERLRQLRDDASSPLQKLEHRMHPFVMYVVMPVFAFANAGVALSSNMAGLFSSGVTWGIISGLFVGKFIGILLFAWLACKWGLARLPSDLNWKIMGGGAMLGGVGFTMSIFIAGLAFTGDTALTDIAKLAILIASTLSGVAGFVILKQFLSDEPAIK